MGHESSSLLIVVCIILISEYLIMLLFNLRKLLKMYRKSQCSSHGLLIYFIALNALVCITRMIQTSLFLTNHYDNISLLITYAGSLIAFSAFTLVVAMW
jgi:hypothetical protein